MNKKSRVFCRSRLAVGVALMLGIKFSAVVFADTEKMDLDIKSQKAGPALMELAVKTGTHIIVPQSIGESLQLPPLNGKYTVSSALDALLRESGLGYEFITEDSVAIKMESENGSDKRRNRDRIDSNDAIEEITVTATKRETSLQDTAMSITALGSDTIEKRGLVQMSDYLSTLPGVTMQDRGAGGVNSIVMRGVASQPQREKEAVSVYFGESPVSGVSASWWGPGGGHADFKMVDIERVEVLRGPQGTLYGAGSMGGTVRIIPAAPNLEQMEGKVAAQYSQTGRLGGDNTMVQGALNIPLVEDKLAIRGVAYRYDDSGYFENVAASYTGPGNVIDTVNAWGGSVKNEGDIGNSETTGARLSALWQPIEPLSVTLGYVRQETDQYGKPEVDTYLPGRFQQVRATAGAAMPSAFNGDTLAAGQGEITEVETNLTSLTIDYDLGWGSVHSSSSWLDRNSMVTNNWARNLSALGNFWSFEPTEYEFFVQEIRFASEFDGPIQVLAGVYYEDKKLQRFNVEGFAGDPGKVDDLIAGLNWFGVPDDAPAGFTLDDWDEFGLAFDWRERLKQTAFFGEVTWNINDQLAATVGARRFQYDQTTFARQVGYEVNRLTPVVARDVAAENQGVTWKANLSWTPTDDILVYFQWSEGFRPGEVLAPLELSAYDPDNTGLYTTTDGARIPISNKTDPDTLQNFELGFKGAFADNRITLNASLYRINWEGLPVLLTLYNFDLGIGFGSTTINAGESVSEGAELEMRWYLADYLHLDLSTSYSESKLAKDQTGLGNKGDDLPGSADFNFSAGLEYSFNLAGYDAFARVDYAYLSEFEAFIGQDDTAPMSGGYGQVHLKSGINLGKLNLDLFVKNLTNEDDITWVSSWPTTPGLTAYRLRPRTIGLNFNYQF